MSWITCFTNFHSLSHKTEVSARPFTYSLTNPVRYQTLAANSSETCQKKYTFTEIIKHAMLKHFTE